MSESIVKSGIIAKEIEQLVVSITLASSIQKIGRFGIEKVARFAHILCDVVRFLISRRLDMAYLTLTPTGTAFFKDSILIWLCKLRGIKIVVHLHGKGIAEYRTRSRFINLYYELTFNKLKVILLSPDLAVDIRGLSVHENVFYLNNGIDESLRAPISYERHISSTTTQILFLSNMVESKGPIDLLRALAPLRDKHQFIVKFAGNWDFGFETAFFQEVDRLSLRNKIAYVGFVGGQEKADLLSGSDLFVFPTYNDCFPLVLLEAMKYGLPVVSTYEGAIGSIVEHNKTGFLVEKRDVVALSSALERLLIDSELRRRFGVEGRKKFLISFTKKRFESSFVELVSTIARS